MVFTTKNKTARLETGRGVRCLARMCQSLIRSHANGPDPKDGRGSRAHGGDKGWTDASPQRNRPMNGTSMQVAVWRLQPRFHTRRFEGRGYLRSRSHVNKFTML
jgi:hypothetical protein